MFKSKVSLLIAVLVVSVVVLSHGRAQPAKKAEREAITAELHRWMSDGQGKLGEEEVIAKLGLADLVENPIDPDSNRNPIADIAMRWQDLSLIEASFKGGKAKQITGRFSPHLKHDKATLANFRTLKTGTGKSDLEKVLGVEDSEIELANGMTRYEWGAKRVLKVYFKDGKVSGTQWQSRG